MKDIIKVHDLSQIQFLSEPLLAPDGKHAAFVVSNADFDTNGYSSYIYVYELESGKIRKLTALGKERGFMWLDSETLVFAAVRGDKYKSKLDAGEHLTVYFKINIHGGEAQEYFTVPLKSAKLKSIGGGRFLTTATYDHARKHLEGLEGVERDKALKELVESVKAYDIFDEIPFWFNGKGVINKRRNRLYIVSDAGENTPLSPELMNVSGYSYDEGRGLVLFFGESYTDMALMTDELFMYDVNSGETKKIELNRDYSISHAEIIGENIVFEAQTREKHGTSENPRFYIMPLCGGEVALFADNDATTGSTVSSDCKYGGGNSFLRDGDTLWYSSTRGFSSYVFKLTPNGNEERITPLVSGSIDAFDKKNNTLFYVGVREMGLQELYIYNVETGEETKVSALNAAYLESHEVSYPEHFIFVDSDGVEIDGWVMKPVDFEQGKTYPCILDMHGGPKVVYGESFFHEMQLWASEGYFVAFCNPRGSDGKGNIFADINAVRYGRDDYNDFMEFMDEVIKRNPAIDTSRVCVTGGSYGGLMTNWIIGHSDRFCCAAAQRSISNFLSKCLTTDIGYYHNLSQIGTTPWADFNAFWQHSPLAYADKVKTPTLFIQSDEDYRCWMADALQMFTALKMHGVDSKVCLFHGENHELSRSGKPKNRAKRLEELTNWFNTYSKSKE